MDSRTRSLVALIVGGILATGLARAEALRPMPVDPMVEQGFHAEYLGVHYRPAEIIPFRVITPDVITWGVRNPYIAPARQSVQASDVSDFVRGIFLSNRREFLPAREEYFSMSDLSLGYVPNPVTGVLLVGIVAAIVAKFKGFHRDSSR